MVPVPYYGAGQYPVSLTVRGVSIPAMRAEPTGPITCTSFRPCTRPPSALQLSEAEVIRFGRSAGVPRRTAYSDALMATSQIRKFLLSQRARVTSAGGGAAKKSMHQRTAPPTSEVASSVM